mgnify:CR=1 FL=1
MNNFVNLLAIFVSSVITSMGLGGGSFYILYLTFFTDTEQFTAQGYNLLIFLPCAVISVLVYAGKKIISFKYIWPIVLGGIAGVIVGYTALSHISSAIVRKMFAAFLLLSGIFSQMYASWIAIGSRTGEMESIVSQREINTDTASYLTALRAALRQINGIIYTSAAENMIAMDSSILQLYKDGRIDKHTTISEAVNPEIMSKRLNLL